MSADVSARPRTLPGEPAPLSALDRPAAIAPPPRVRYDRAGNPRKPRHSASMWRLRTYMRPYLGRFVLMVFFAFLGVGATVVIPLVTRAVIDGPVAQSDQVGLWALGLLAAGLGVLEALLTFLRRWIVAVGTVGTETGIRLDMYAKLQRLPMAFHARWQSGQLLSRMMSDLSTTRRFLGFGLLFIVMNVVQIGLVTALLLHMYWPLGLVVVASIVPITWSCLRNEKEYTRLSRQIQDQTGDVASAVEEGAHGLRVIKAFGRARWIFDKFDARSLRLYETSMARVRLSARFWTFLEIIPSVTLIIVLGFGAVAAGQGRVTLGTLVAFITLMLSLVWPVAALGFLLAMAQEAMTAADRIAEIFDAENVITDGDAELAEVSGRLRFSRVGFRFPDGDTDVLHDIDLELAPGETVALVGATGAGKSVFTALVPRLYDVTAGSISIDGVDVRDLRLSRLRTIVAAAFEDPTLFSMSARENITLGRPGASDEEIAEAIEVAQAQFVYDLPWGLATRIGEQGMSLSGGQRQRLALARAVLARPAILVLDDTLSALDIHTEALVEDALRRVLVGVTGIVVAHRASTVLLADRVAVLVAGTIAHVGTHAELLATVPEYRDLLSADIEEVAR
ncbi:ABC transporter ATP-binding protein [Microlunatus ginsengisoli]|uniref:ABC transporter ATP-binding protein n=1 Tax=Microlunatus ginsengisoli TaxID=363863 RepID=A0ABP7A1M4_9ACTN